MTQKRLIYTRTRRQRMEKLINSRCRNQLWLVVFALFVFWYLLLYVYDWSSLRGLTSFSRPTLSNSFKTHHESKSVDFILSSKIDQSKGIEKEPINGKAIEIDRNGDSADQERELEPKDQILMSEKEEDEDDKRKPIGNSDQERELEPKDQILMTEKEDEDDKRQPITEKNDINGNQERELNLRPNDQILMREKENAEKVAQNGVESCSGRYIYIHDIPSRFDYDLIKQCGTLNKWTDMCQYMTNMGLGPKLPNTGWFSTNQFSLEVIFHNRMKQYECLTKNSSEASAIFVPYYAGLEVARFLWGFNTSVRDSGSLDIAKWLREKPEWKGMFGRDHFLVVGRITWDFRRGIDEDSAWGNKLMLLPESKNMTILTIESSPWNSNDFGIPYPTYFHPSRDNDVFQWQNKIRKQKRRFLFCFAGAPRPNIEGSIRNEIIEQCQSSGGRKCKLLQCNNAGNKCLKPIYVMKMFQNSVFCLQPPGDSFTRRSIFDSILAGCIPVFFHPASAYVQYLWHLPKNFKKYSILIPEEEVQNRTISIERELVKISKAKVAAMREEVVKLIPKVVYADPRSKLETIEDAFDITVKGVLERVERLRTDLKEGRNSSENVDEEESWKYNFFGKLGKNEWDHYFLRTNKVRYW